MTEKHQVYKCLICGNIVQINHVGVGELVCCNQLMNLQIENIEDATIEKHVPVVEKIKGGIKIKVGEVAHPMEEDHFIEWIEIIAGGENQKVFLKVGDQPEVFFAIKSDDFVVRAYCNLHGLWKAIK
ncbi:MAG: desulfoferrodoxin [Candidatus Moranbacteria bacterium]|nr:desulfoferrodoxin [Candidatus Moranbacteria bacterium]